MLGANWFHQSSSIFSLTSNSNRRNHPKPFSIRASAAPKLPLASRIFVRIKLVKDENTKRSRGYAFVQYTSQDDAMQAIENLDRKHMDGRVVYVELAKPMNFQFAAYPRTSGPPKGQNSESDQQ